MPNEPKAPQPEKASNPIALWLSIGVAIGTSPGVVFDNIPIGVALGIMVGTSVGLAVKTRK